MLTALISLNPASEDEVNLLARIHRLEDELRQLRDDFMAFVGVQQNLKAEADELTNHVGKNFSEDRKRIRTLEEWFGEIKRPKAEKRQYNQIAILNSLLAASYPQWRLAEDIREKMQLSKTEFSKLMKLMKEGDIEIKHDRNDKRKKLLRKRVKV